jgi:hypothetical protein
MQSKNVSPLFAPSSLILSVYRDSQRIYSLHPAGQSTAASTSRMQWQETSQMARYRRSFAAGCTFRPSVFQTFAQLTAPATDPRLQAQAPNITSRSTINARGQYRYGDGSSNRTHVILRTTGYPDPRPAHYDSSSQMLYQMMPQQATKSLGTSGNSWQYHPAWIEITRQFLAASTSSASSQDPRPPPTSVPVTVLLETSRFIWC